MFSKFNKDINLVIFIFVLALAFRLIYILLVPALPVYTWSDDGYYNDTANNLYSILSNMKMFVREFLKGNLGRGNGILDSYGMHLPFGILHHGFIYSLFIVFIYLMFGLNNFHAVWITQSLVGSLSCVLLYFIGNRIFNKKIAFFAAILMSLYLPIIKMTNQLRQETLIIFLILATVLFLIKAIQKKSKLDFFIGFFCLFLVITGRAVFIYLFIILLAGIIYILIKERDRILFKVTSVGFLLGFIIPLLLWMSLVALEFGKFGKILISQAGARDIYMAYIIPTSGWLTDEDREKLGPHLTQELKKQGFFWNESIKNPPDEILFKATLNIWRRNPKGALLLILQRVKRLWLDYRIPNVFFIPLYIAIYYLSLIGIFIALFKQRLSIILSSIIVYVTFIHGLIAAEPRYNLTVMPFVMLFLCFSFSFLRDTFLFQKPNAKKKTILFLLSGLTFYFISKILTVPILLLLFKKMHASSAFIFNIFLKNLSISLIILSTYMLLRHKLERRKAIASVSVTFLCFFVLLNTWAYSSNQWRQWKSPLLNSKQRVCQEILLPSKFLKNAQSAYLKIDMEQIKFPFGHLIVKVNDEIIRTYNRELTVDGEPFPSFFEYKYVINNPAKMRKWFSIPFDLSILKKSNTCFIELFLSNTAHSKEGWIRIFGDYPLKRKDSIFFGPLFGDNPFETSLLKYKYDGDYRLYGKIKLESIITKSKFYNGDRWVCNDLSQDLGIQRGQYRIRLQIIDKNDKVYTF